MYTIEFSSAVEEGMKFEGKNGYNTTLSEVNQI